jgi:hypothetical protein
MFYYHDTAENHRRLAAGICRCQSEEQDRVVNLRDLVLGNRLRSVHSPAELLDAPVVNGNDDHLEKPYRFIFAVSQNFEIRIALDHLRVVDNAVKHETLFHNANVLAAGEIYFENGVVIEINDRSGSYGTLGMLETAPGFAEAVLTAFERNGIPVLDSLREFLGDKVQ